ncbi:uncharacterized protein LY79DRAFT_572672 [Colletotrichum navitas]|uniref:Uncharacterized protein n=1 Tax=Colletotrichum navitas TaxID=681940 RepID=A0AAD8UX91_9PEZI|nr:uncharacterized protein LY79DRAFT_572672 [Colletotrichum navitas]KAK1566103.1 hypothetical protein LY79DRAFT_572672 [Colletotrichum navitas]
MSPPLRRAPRVANQNHPNYLAHRVWVPLVPQGIDEQAERSRLQDIHNTFLDAFENGTLKLPGVVSPSANDLTSEAADDLSTLQACVYWQQKKRTSIDFIAASCQVKACGDGTAATIHLLTTQSDTDDLKWLYRKAFLALHPGGWLMQLQVHHQQPQAHQMHMLALASHKHTQPLTDPVKTTLQEEGFIQLSLSVARASSATGTVSAKVPSAATGTYEMRVWTAQKPWMCGISGEG